MSNEIKIIKTIQLNKFFEYNEKVGVYEETSCGDFGSRFFIEYDGKSAMWGTVISEH